MTSPSVRRKPWVLSLARWYGQRRMARAFDGLFVEGLEEAKERASRGPLILAMNHVAWWDSFVVVQIDRAMGSESYCLMDADNLEKLPFFGWIGAVPLRRSEPRAALADIKASARLLDRPGRVLWIFPQGTQRPAHLRPLGLQRGVSILAGLSGAPVLPVALTYAFREAPEPTIAVSIGAPCVVRRTGALVELEESLVAGLDRNDVFVTTGRGSYKAIVPPRREQKVPLAGRLLARIGGSARA